MGVFARVVRFEKRMVAVALLGNLVVRPSSESFANKRAGPFPSTAPLIRRDPWTSDPRPSVRAADIPYAAVRAWTASSFYSLSATLGTERTSTLEGAIL